MRRTLAVGHFLNAPFVEACTPHVGRIREVFFAWPGVLSCRPAPDFTDEVRARMMADLRWCKANGILLDTLFNCNCYGDIAISPELADLVTRTLGEMDAEGLFPDIMTTTSPFIATVLRQRFPQVKIRFSVNMRIHGTLGFEPVMELFDSFYASREHHRDLAWLAKLGAWSRAHGKVLGMQVNSGCLRQCPFQTFHDNLHGHNRLAQSKVGEQFDFSVFRCKTNYERGNYEDFLRATWIRPEDLPLYEEHVEIVKLATRRHAHPVEVLNAYATYAYDGNLADLMDPVHAFPKAFDNKAFDTTPLWPEVRSCAQANDCTHCGKCTKLLETVFR
ncbi:MAG: hypothetical protein ACI4TC_10815 [Kiritimatiellia bacterium]